MGKSGIYSITNETTGKVYYGSSTDIIKRWNGHKSKLRKGLHPNGHLQSSWNKYGETVFLFCIEEEARPEDLELVEQYYLDWCKIFPFWSYNIGYDAECAVRGIKFGPPSEEHRRKIGMANSGPRNANFGKRLSKETCMKMSMAKKGIPKPPRSEEHKRHLSMSLSGERHWRFDKTIYTFVHPKHGTQKCDSYTLTHKYELCKRCVRYIINGDRKSHKGWRILHVS